MIDRALATKNPVRIKLAAQPKGNVVAVTAEAEGAFDSSAPVRLRLALAEERVAMHGSNGIREHEMVVRAMPGGPRGIEIKDGKLRYEGTVDVKAIREKLDDYLKGLEEQSKAPFPAKPLDLKHLHLVAFVQNDGTGEVYQAATVPFPSSGAAGDQHKTSAALDGRALNGAAAPNPKAIP
jgi:hypothetical protein